MVASINYVFKEVFFLGEQKIRYERAEDIGEKEEDNTK